MSRYYEYADGGLREVDNLISVDEVLEIIDKTDDYGESSHTAMMMAAKALETENAVIDRVLEIIDEVVSEANMWSMGDMVDKIKYRILAMKGGEQ